MCIRDRGWYVHEWLWRDDTADLNEKSADIESIYTINPVETYVKIKVGDEKFILAEALVEANFPDTEYEVVEKYVGCLLYTSILYTFSYSVPVKSKRPRLRT